MWSTYSLKATIFAVLFPLVGWRTWSQRSIQWCPAKFFTSQPHRLAPVHCSFWVSKWVPLQYDQYEQGNCHLPCGHDPVLPRLPSPGQELLHTCLLGWESVSLQPRGDHFRYSDHLVRSFQWVSYGKLPPSWQFCPAGCRFASRQVMWRAGLAQAAGGFCHSLSCTELFSGRVVLRPHFLLFWLTSVDSAWVLESLKPMCLSCFWELNMNRPVLAVF